ncbi:MAG: hypothetical protein ACOYT8_03945 [Candidatus Dependentiae bacterium]
MNLSAQTLTIGLLEPSTIPCKPIQLIGYQHFILNQIITDQKINQLEELLSYIKKFIREHALKKYSFCIALHHSVISEKFLSQPSEFVSSDLFCESGKQYNCTYLGSQSESFIFYQCALAMPLLFQLNLIGIKLKKDIPLITTTNYCLLWLIKHIKGQAFRHAQLTSYIQQNNLTIAQHTVNELVNRFVHNPKLIDINNQMAFLLPLIGLYCMKEGVA